MIIRVPIEETPKEAHKIAADFRRAATEVRKLGEQLRAVSNSLESNWDGLSKEMFMLGFRDEPKNLESYAGYLEGCASKIEKIKVIKWVEKKVEV